MASHHNILEKPVGICPEHISTEPTTLRMKQDTSKLSSTTGYTITDSTGNSVLYTSDKKSSGWDSCRSIYDSIGVRLFDLDHSRQFWSIKLPDQQGDPVATIFRRCYNDADYIGIRFVDSASGRDVTLSVRGKFTVKKDDKCATSKDVCVYVDDTLVIQTKMVNRYTSRVPFKTNEWEVFVAQGMDLSLVCHRIYEYNCSQDTNFSRPQRSQCISQSYFVRSQW
jgi:hypothetical protein